MESVSSTTSKSVSTQTLWLSEFLFQGRAHSRKHWAERSLPSLTQYTPITVSTFRRRKSRDSRSRNSFNKYSSTTRAGDVRNNRRGTRGRNGLLGGEAVAPAKMESTRLATTHAAHSASPSKGLVTRHHSVLLVACPPPHLSIYRIRTTSLASVALLPRNKRKKNPSSLVREK